MEYKVPKHIAIIMDGNGRWAQRRGHPRVFGHVRGSSRVKDVVRQASELGVQALTLYAFSTENWERPEAERQVLWKLLKRYLLKEADELERENIRLQVIGEIDRLDSDIQQILKKLILKLAKNTGLVLTFALSYGAQRELSDAARKFARDCVLGLMKPEDMSEQLMERYLSTVDLGELAPVDLFIRTSGEQRVSNFLLWQAAYAEFVFLDVCWPDFMPKHLIESVAEYARRDRRFGRVLSTVQTVGLVRTSFPSVDSMIPAQIV